MTEKLSDIIDEMFKLREQKRELDAQSKEVGKQYEALALRFAEAARAAGTDYARGSLASASITTQLVPQAKDWDEIYDWIRENDAMYLLHRRIASAAWKELLDSGEEIPGIEAYEKEGVSLNKLG
jgi:hypothetical protein